MRWPAITMPVSWDSLLPATNKRAARIRELVRCWATPSSWGTYWPMADLTPAAGSWSGPRIVAALRDLAAHSAELGNTPAVFVPPPTDLRLEQVRLPRDAYFDRHTDVPVAAAPGRIAAEMITPYPPGIPVALPGERLTKPVLDYLTTGVRAGMFLPDAADRNLDTVRVVAEHTDR